MKHLLLELTALSLFWSPLQAERLQFPTWERILDRREPGPQRLCAFQNGRMVTLNKEGNGVRIENLLDGTSFEKVMKSPPSRRLVINAVAVSFEGTCGCRCLACRPFRIHGIGYLVVWARRCT